MDSWFICSMFNIVGHASVWNEELLRLEKLISTNVNAVYIWFNILQKDLSIVEHLILCWINIAPTNSATTVIKHKTIVRCPIIVDLIESYIHLEFLSWIFHNGSLNSKCW